MRRNVITKNYFDNLILAFELFVCLRILNDKYQHNYAQLFNYVFSKIRHELKVFVIDYNAKNVSIIIHKIDKNCFCLFNDISNVFIANKQYAFRKFANNRKYNIEVIFNNRHNYYLIHYYDVKKYRRYDYRNKFVVNKISFDLI